MKNLTTEPWKCHLTPQANIHYIGLNLPKILHIYATLSKYIMWYDCKNLNTGSKTMTTYEGQLIIW